MQADMRQQQRSWLKFRGMNRRRNSVSKRTAPASGAAISGAATPGSAVGTTEQSWQQQTRTTEQSWQQRRVRRKPRRYRRNNRASLNRFYSAAVPGSAANPCAHDRAAKPQQAAPVARAADAPKPTARKKTNAAGWCSAVRSEARNSRDGTCSAGVRRL